MIVHNFDPVFIDLGVFQIRWYSIAYIVGIILGWIYAIKIIKEMTRRHNLTMINRTIFDDLIIYLVIGIVVGGRLGYVILYNFQYYIANPVDALMIWKGGMSFHGGLIGTCLAIWLFCRKKSFAVYTIADLAAQAVPIGLGFGRIGNFINGELFGRATDMDWCIVFPRGGNVCRHPSQLYEAGLEGITLFLLLWIVGRRNTPPGTVFWGFIAGYGFFRSFVELFREPDAHLGYLLGPLTMGQLLSIPMFLFGVLMIVKGYQNRSISTD